MSLAAPHEAAPGVFRIELPLPWELETVNVYAVALEDGFALIDTGVGTPECFAALSAALDALAIGWRDIRLVVVTHTHPDHSGLAARLLEITGARLWMHGEEIEQLRIYADPERHREWQTAALELAGVPEGLRERMRHVFEGMSVSFAALEPAVSLRGGETLAAQSGPFEIVWTPGHSPGHVCLYRRDTGLLLSGDQLLERITPNVGWLPARDVLGSYLESLRMLDTLPVSRVLPSHGSPFARYHERIAETLRHHEERCREILGHVAAQPLTAHEVSARLWKRPLGALNRYFAAMEALAHLVYLERRGQVASVKHGPALLWSAA